ncbi:cytochrome C oxidase subunit IV family protein [Mycobacterium sp. JS623]|uniref:cytochrome C oxidase subunit IV family protein n=1 Tax=Mycobacterium sp. JS623 TaxID=212767 RepID=UPI0012F91761
MTILAVAFIKVNYLAQDFMELRSAPRFLRIAMRAWIVGVLLLLVVLYLATAGRA